MLVSLVHALKILNSNVLDIFMNIDYSFVLLKPSSHGCDFTCDVMCICDCTCDAM